MERGTMAKGRYSASLMPSSQIQRRDFLKLAGLAAASGRLAAQQPQSFLKPTGTQDVAKTDFTLRSPL